MAIAIMIWRRPHDRPSRSRGSLDSRVCGMGGLHLSKRGQLSDDDDLNLIVHTSRNEAAGWNAVRETTNQDRRNEAATEQVGEEGLGRKKEKSTRGVRPLDVGFAGRSRRDYRPASRPLCVMHEQRQIWWCFGRHVPLFTFPDVVFDSSSDHFHSVRYDLNAYTGVIWLILPSNGLGEGVRHAWNHQHEFVYVVIRSYFPPLRFVGKVTI